MPDLAGSGRKRSRQAIVDKNKKKVDKEYMHSLEQRQGERGDYCGLL